MGYNGLTDLKEKKTTLLFYPPAIMFELNGSSCGVSCLRCKNAHTDTLSRTTNISTDVDLTQEANSYATVLTQLHATNIEIFRR